MYPKYHILVLGLVLLGHSIQAKSYNEQTGHAAQSDNRQRYDDFYLDEQQDWPGDDSDYDSSEEGSGFDGSGIREGSADGPLTLCMTIRDQLREKHQDAYIPRCTDAGLFESLQCNYQTGECWCVTRSGDKIPNTVARLPHKPNCDDVDREQPVRVRPPETKPEESEEETDDSSNSIDIDDTNEIGIDSPTDSGTGTNIPNKIDPIPGAEIIEADDNNGLSSSVSNPELEPMKASPIWGEPGILAGIIGGAVVGLLCAVLLVMFIVYRMRKKDEGSYALDEPKRSPSIGYTKAREREFFA